MTFEERQKLKRLNDVIMGGALYSLIALPYAVLLGVKSRRMPQYRAYYLRRMILVPTIPLIIMTGAGYMAQEHVKTLSRKYFDQLSD